MATVIPYTWTEWNQQYYYYTRSVNSTAVWQAWNYNMNSTATVTTMPYTNEQIWQVWASTTAITTIPYSNYAYAPKTEEQKAAREERAREEQKAHEARLKAQAETKERAEKLLHEFLEEKQSKELIAKGYFDVSSIAPDGTVRHYRVRKGNTVAEVNDKGKILRTFCIHPSGGVPVADEMLAQKLMLEGDIESFYKIANIAEVA